MATLTRRAALYVRVSTSDRGQTIENQLQPLQEAALGWSIVPVHRDEGISGAKGRQSQPGLDALLKGVARRDFDLVAAWSVLTRATGGAMQAMRRACWPDGADHGVHPDRTMASVVRVDGPVTHDWSQDEDRKPIVSASWSAQPALHPALRLHQSRGGREYRVPFLTVTNASPLADEPVAE
jgi:hypothetical protein